MATIDSNNCIPTGLRADIMRSSMENKNLLSKKGSIYVGTGETVTVGGEKIYKTKALELGSSGQVLIVKDGELKYSTLTNENFDSSTDYKNLTNSLNRIETINSQFSRDASYNDLQIINENFVEGRNYPNIRLLYNDSGTDCSLVGASFAISKNIKLVQDTVEGKLSMSYWGESPVLYRTCISASIKWTNVNGNSDSVTVFFIILGSSSYYSQTDLLKCLYLQHIGALYPAYQVSLSPGTFFKISFENKSYNVKAIYSNNSASSGYSIVDASFNINKQYSTTLAQ